MAGLTGGSAACFRTLDGLYKSVKFSKHQAHSIERMYLSQQHGLLVDYLKGPIASYGTTF